MQQVSAQTTLKTVLQIPTRDADDQIVFADRIVKTKEFQDAARGWALTNQSGRRKTIDSLKSRCVPLGSVATVTGAATVNEAYELTKINHAGTSTIQNSFRLINSGTIDRYTTTWPIKAIQYIKKKYDKPIVGHAELQAALPNRFKQAAKSPKIIVAGMTLSLECFLDGKGEYLAAKSTTVIQSAHSLKLLTAFLNSSIANCIYAFEFGGDRLQGGYLRVGPPQLKLLPVPKLETLESSLVKDIEGKVDYLRSEYVAFRARVQ